jgi:hypothetical protein
MAWWEVIWEWDEEDGNVAHLAEHDLTPDNVEHAIQNAVRQERRRSSQRPLLFGIRRMDEKSPSYMK